MLTNNKRMKHGSAPVPAHVLAITEQQRIERLARYAAQCAQREAQQADEPFAPVVGEGASKRKIRQRNYRAK